MKMRHYYLIKLVIKISNNKSNKILIQNQINHQIHKRNNNNLNILFFQKKSMVSI